MLGGSIDVSATLINSLPMQNDRDIAHPTLLFMHKRALELMERDSVITMVRMPHRSSQKLSCIITNVST
jgi:hypothetical protein